MHHALDGGAIIGVHRQLDRLPHAKLVKLRLFEVGGNKQPGVGRNVHEGLPGLHQLANLHQLLANRPTSWRRNARERELECGVVTIRERGTQAGERQSNACLHTGNIGAGCRCLTLYCHELCTHRGRLGLGAIQLLLADDILGRQVCIACQIRVRLHHLRLCSVNICALHRRLRRCRLNHRLGLTCTRSSVNRCARGGKICVHLGESHLELAIIDHHQGGVLRHAIVLGDRDCGDKSSNLGQHRQHVTINHRVVCAFMSGGVCQRREGPVPAGQYQGAKNKRQQAALRGHCF